MQLQAGPHRYEWQADWAQIPPTESSRRGWAHPGMAVDKTGHILTFHQGDPRLLVFNPDGSLVRSVDTNLTEGHGLTLVEEVGVEYLWIADSGGKRDPAQNYDRGTAKPAGQVVKMTLDGQIVQTIGAPDLPIYKEGAFSPTGVIVDEERFGGTGDVWITDGYAQNQIHQFEKGGQLLNSITGEEGAAGAFKTPHGIWFDRRKSETELYIADRASHRIQVYDLTGKYKRTFGSEVLSSPCCLAADGDLLVVAELRSRLALFDVQDQFIGHLGDNSPVADQPGWPNQLDPAGNPSRTTRLEPGKFNSPHGMTVDQQGNIYVAEWLIGGRYDKLTKVA